MNLNKKVLIIVLVAIALAGSFYAVRKNAPEDSCPDEMIVNRMPGPSVGVTRYYIKDGKRAEFSEYNYLWAKIICGVKTQTVY